MRHGDKYSGVITMNIHKTLLTQRLSTRPVCCKIIHNEYSEKCSLIFMAVYNNNATVVCGCSQSTESKVQTHIT